MSCDSGYQFEVPKFILLLSGKRKSGKDYVANVLLEKLGSQNCIIVRLSGPLKKQYAQEHGLNFGELLDSTSYKEIYRSKMIMWGEEKRNKDPGFFCRLAIEQSDAVAKMIWIISDARRESDVKYFMSQYPNVTWLARISASLEVRSSRGFTFTQGVDDCESECGLDNHGKFDFLINNDNDETLLKNLNSVIEMVKGKCSL